MQEDPRRELKRKLRVEKVFFCALSSEAALFLLLIVGAVTMKGRAGVCVYYLTKEATREIDNKNKWQVKYRFV